MERLDQSNIEHLIVDTVTMLCRNSISYSSELRIQGTLGITVDTSSVIFIQLNKCFRHGSEDSHSDRGVSAYDGRAAADSRPKQAGNHLLAGIKRPRITSAVNCTRKPVGFGRGRMQVTAVRRVHSGRAHAAIVPRGAARCVRQQLSFPSPNKVALTKPSGGLSQPNTPGRHATLLYSPQFHAGHVTSVSEATLQLPPVAQLEVEDIGQSSLNKEALTKPIAPSLCLSPQFRARHVTAGTVAVNEASQQLPTKLEVEDVGQTSPNNVALTKPSGGFSHTPVQHVIPALCSSPQFRAGHVTFAINEAPPQLPLKLEVADIGQSSANKAQTKPAEMSSDVICIESDDEAESAAKVKPDASTLRSKHDSVKSEGESLDALQMIVDRAARTSIPGMVGTFWMLLYPLYCILLYCGLYIKLNFVEYPGIIVFIANRSCNTT